MRESSKVVDKCQICNNPNIIPIIMMGYLPPVNEMHKIGERPHEQPSYPAQLLICPECGLVQLGLVVNPKILFPSSYPYTSSTTKILRDNFTELYKECTSLINLSKNDLIIDIGSNDGNLLVNFKDNHRVLGITPEKIGEIAISRGVPTIIDYFNSKTAKRVKSRYGKAKIVTATNVFAHIDNPNQLVEDIKTILDEDGVFISESHYLQSVIGGMQYDTLYHEHQRYYSLKSLKYLFDNHGLEIFHVTKIPTHGGSIRVYTTKKGNRNADESVSRLLEEESKELTPESFEEFKKNVVLSKLELYSILLSIKNKGGRIYGISAPSRASTLINYVGIDDGILDCVLEVKGSQKIGKYIPGTIIPILEESKLFEDQPEYALILSWHIADELIPKLMEKGYEGKFIIPLPIPHIV